MTIYLTEQELKAITKPIRPWWEVIIINGSLGYAFAHALVEQNWMLAIATFLGTIAAIWGDAWNSYQRHKKIVNRAKERGRAYSIGSPESWLDDSRPKIECQRIRFSYRLRQIFRF